MHPELTCQNVRASSLRADCSHSVHFLVREPCSRSFLWFRRRANQRVVRLPGEVGDRGTLRASARSRRRVRFGDTSVPEIDSGNRASAMLRRRDAVVVAESAGEGATRVETDPVSHADDRRTGRLQQVRRSRHPLCGDCR